MKIESFRLKNFKALKDVQFSKLPNFCVFVGANGTGKSSLFQMFSFLHDAYTDNVNIALTKLGGNRFKEVCSRNAKGPIEIELKFRLTNKGPLITYFLQIDQENELAFVAREVLKYRRGKSGQPWSFLDFTNGTGKAVAGELDSATDVRSLDREKAQTLKSPDLLAIKGLSQFKQFPAILELGNLIENWHISDFHINKANRIQEAGFAEHLSREGENLSLVIDYLYKYHKAIFDQIIEQLKHRIPGISQIEAKTTEEGRVLLKIQDAAFEDPFLARNVSDGTIKMLAYLVLLYDPKPHPLLCVEEPENQLYPTLLHELAETFREYARRGGQVFVSTHSPEFLNGTNLEEVFWLEKKGGYTTAHRASDNAQLKAYMADGDKMGYLWQQGLFIGADPLPLQPSFGQSHQGTVSDCWRQTPTSFLS